MRLWGLISGPVQPMSLRLKMRMPSRSRYPSRNYTRWSLSLFLLLLLGLHASAWLTTLFFRVTSNFHERRRSKDLWHHTEKPIRLNQSPCLELGRLFGLLNKCLVDATVKYLVDTHFFVASKCCLVRQNIYLSVPKQGSCLFQPMSFPYFSVPINERCM